MSKKKILFIPGYFYLATEQFLEIAESISDEYDSTFLKIDMPGTEVEKINSPFSEEFFADKNVTFKSLKLNGCCEDLKEKEEKLPNGSRADKKALVEGELKVPMYTMLKRFLVNVISKYEGREVDVSAPLREGGHGFWVNTLCMMYHSLDKCLDVIPRLGYLFKSPNKNVFLRKIRASLEEIKPSCVIVNSDLGHIGVLYALLACRIMNIKIYIVPTADIETARKGFWVNLRIKITNILYTFSSDNFKVFRLHTFSSNLIGEFALKAKILTSSRRIRDKLVSQGIKKRRVVLCKLPPVKRLSDETLVKFKLGVDGKSKLIVFYTECLHEVYSKKEVIEVHHKLALIFKQMMSEQDVVVVVKPHPRELLTLEIKQRLLIDTFAANGITVVEDIETDLLLGSSFLNIAHYSKVLITSCVLDVPILSFSFNGRRSENSFMSDDVKSLVEIEDYNLLAQRVLNIISSEQEYKNLKKACGRLRRNFVADDMSNFKDLGTFFRKELRHAN